MSESVLRYRAVPPPASARPASARQPPPAARPASARQQPPPRLRTPVAAAGSAAPLASPGSAVKGSIRTRITKADQSYRKGGGNITVKAESARIDVQRAYQQMYYGAQAEDADDAMGGSLKRRFRAASYRLGGQDWEFLFHTYDRNNDGGLSFAEFLHATRRDAMINPGLLSDTQLEDIFNRIDIDGDCLVSCEEFMKWIGHLENEDDLMRDGFIGESEDGSDDGSDDGKPHRKAKNRVPFVAEYIALQRATLRSGQDLSSPKVGMLGAGEVVAVLQVKGRRMKVQRLKYQAKPSSGWVSDRTADLKPIMELLPRTEWSSVTKHTTAVAERVASLNALPEKPETTPGTWYSSIFAAGKQGTARPVKGARILSTVRSSKSRCHLRAWRPSWRTR